MIYDANVSENIQKAAQAIQTGNLVAFPTETVYGLGADAFNEKALKKIFELKKRPYEDPLILHISNKDQLILLAKSVSADAQLLINSFWPGPLTLVFKKNSKVSYLATGGLDTVAVRMPSNQVALELIDKSGCIIAAPSANKFQSISPTRAQHVESEFGDELDIILDGGACKLGLESTIVSCVDEVKILRLGAVAVESIEDCLRRKINIEVLTINAIKSPGMFEFHYAPKTRLLYVSDHEIQQYANDNSFNNTALVCFSNSEKQLLQNKGFKFIYVLSQAGDYMEAAKNYYALIRELDVKGYEGILCFKLPESNLGRSINDRMKKAQRV